MSGTQVLAVVGAGAMGAGIAQIGLTAGLKVVLFDLDAAALSRAAASIGERVARLVEKGQLAPGAAEEATGRLTLAGSLSELAGADVVIEAIVERLEPKQALFRELEAVVREDAILATNTSSLSVAAIARDCRHRARVCGMHFFNPVPVMKLVEIVEHPETAPAVRDAAVALSRRIGKVPVTVRDAPGFLVNLGGRAYVTEALHAAEERVADYATIDGILRDGAGFRMGPFELMDLTGIDVNYPATSFIYEGYRNDPRLKTTPLHEAMFQAGRFGRKTGLGFHRYGEPQETGAPEPEAPGGGEFAFRLPEAIAGLDRVRGLPAPTEAGQFNLIAPLGEDAASATARLGLDPASVVAIDLTGIERDHVTLMAPLGGGAGTAASAALLRGHGYKVAIVRDSPGFILQRVLAMVANLGCEMAQTGLGTPDDIDTAMKLAQNYPRGPFEIVDWLGARTVLTILERLQATTGSDRYRPSLWLRRRALLGRPIRELD